MSNKDAEWDTSECKMVTLALPEYNRLQTNDKKLEKALAFITGLITSADEPDSEPQDLWENGENFGDGVLYADTCTAKKARELLKELNDECQKI